LLNIGDIGKLKYGLGLNDRHVLHYVSSSLLGWTTFERSDSDPGELHAECGRQTNI